MVPAFGAGFFFCGGYPKNSKLQSQQPTSFEQCSKPLADVPIYWLLHDIKKCQKKLGSSSHPPKKIPRIHNQGPTSTGAHLGGGATWDDAKTF